MCVLAVVALVNGALALIYMRAAVRWKRDAEASTKVAIQALAGWKECCSLLKTQNEIKRLRIQIEQQDVLLVQQPERVQ